MTTTVLPARVSHDEGESLALEQYSAGALEAQTRGEIDIQITTAKRFPRSESVALKKAVRLATMTEEIAEACFYALPRDGKTIEGPSARLAEIMTTCWGHMRSEARVVEETENHLVCRGTSWDLENNVAVSIEVRRRITGKNNKRYNEDMIAVTANAGNSIAFRNAVLKVIPRAFWSEVYNKAREVAIGDAKTLVAKRTAMFAHFQKMGVIEARVLAVLGIQGVEDVTLEHLAVMKGIATAIREGDTSVDEAFPNPTGAPVKMPERQSDKPPAPPPPPDDENPGREVRDGGPKPPERQRASEVYRVDDIVADAQGPAPASAQGEGVSSVAPPAEVAAGGSLDAQASIPAPAPVQVVKVEPFKKPGSDKVCHFADFSDGSTGYTYDEAIARDLDAAAKLGADLRVVFSGQVWRGRKEIVSAEAV